MFWACSLLTWLAGTQPTCNCSLGVVVQAVHKRSRRFTYTGRGGDEMKREKEERQCDL